jgi:hypothetical protein
VCRTFETFPKNAPYSAATNAVYYDQLAALLLGPVLSLSLSLSPSPSPSRAFPSKITIDAKIDFHGQMFIKPVDKSFLHFYTF